ncbi:MAG: ATP-binding protein [Lachnospiraceae bacterium]|nr:ATP-binding protein [Lachnospiraceae bacterium]
MALTNEQYNMIMRHYDRLRAEDHALLMERTDEVMEKVAGFRELDEAIAEKSVDAAVARIRGRSLPEDIGLTLRELGEKKKQLLVDNGYPAEYLEDVYHCRDCRDTGFIDGEKCHCFHSVAASLLYSADEMLSVLRDKDISDFDLSLYSDGVSEKLEASPRDCAGKALNDSIDFIEHMGERTQNFLFYGNTGTGKTFLSACIGNEALKRGLSVVYITAIRLMEAFEGNTFGGKDSAAEASQAVERIYDCDLLIIDDLGTELHNSFTDSQLFALVNDRIIKERSTIISTNLFLRDLQDRYSERIFSRLFSSYEIYLMMGDDIRLKKMFSRS